MGHFDSNHFASNHHGSYHYGLTGTSTVGKYHFNTYHFESNHFGSSHFGLSIGTTNTYPESVVSAEIFGTTTIDISVPLTELPVLGPSPWGSNAINIDQRKTWHNKSTPPIGSWSTKQSDAGVVPNKTVWNKPNR